ncbi:MAG TPA: transposase, partial [Chitinophagales bacterium]|nr:transposase [Chitinophagales bacterium]
MKTNWLIVILIIIFFGVLYAVNYYGKSVPKLPLLNTKLYNEDSTEFPIQSLKGKVTIVSFFQTWCGDCRAEAKELTVLQNKVGGTEKLEVFLITDEYGGYFGIKSFMPHKVIEHKVWYVNGDAHTNNIESFWALLKRGIVGQYHKVSLRYLPKYIDEFCYRHNNRKSEDIFGLTLQRAMG